MTRKFSLLTCFLALACAPSVHAAWQDRDLPPSDRLPEAAALATGRFERLPEAYYLARYERLLPRLDAATRHYRQGEADADLAALLPLFSDAATALARLSRCDEALGWLEQELTLAELAAKVSVPAAKHARIRARTNRANVLEARGLAAAARAEWQAVLAEDRFDLNAHFGLSYLDWKDGNPAWDEFADTFPNLLGIEPEAFRRGRGPDAPAREGLDGALLWMAARVAQGSGWVDADLMYAFSLLVWLQGQETVAALAWQRACELLDKGKTTVVRGAPGAAALKRLWASHLGVLADDGRVLSLYRNAREQGDAEAASRAAFLARRLEVGEHPDDSPTFWAAWEIEQTAPPPAEPGADDSSILSPAFVIGSPSALLVIMLAIGGVTILMGRRGRDPG
jgi:hypothetical protein